MLNVDDPASLSLDELRARRAGLQRDDDAVSYVRRVVQTRLDLVRAEQQRRGGAGPSDDVSGELRDVLSNHLAGGAARPPRPDEDLGDHELADELDTICAERGFDELDQLDASDLADLEHDLAAFERRVSDDRRARFDRLDALSAELVRRYREGEASVDGLFGS